MLNTQPNIARFDDFYEALLAAHQDLPLDQSHALNARLVLLLANHIGDQATLQHALQLARGSAVPMADRRTTPAITPVVPTHAIAA